MLGMLRAKAADRMVRAPSIEDRLVALAVALRARRKSLRLTQIELSRLSGTGPDFVYDVERGKPTLRLDKLLQILEVLGLELVLGEGKETLRVAVPVAPPPAVKKGRARTGA